MEIVTTYKDIDFKVIVSGYKISYENGNSLNKYNLTVIGYLVDKKLVESLNLDVKSTDYKKEDEYCVSHPIALIHDIIETNNNKEL